MAEEAAEQEKQPVFDIFTVSKNSVLRAFKALNPKENPSAGEAISDEKEEFYRTNPHVSDYVSDFVKDMRKRGLAEEIINQITWGVLICHRVLREEAATKKGVLPTLTDEFIEEYHQRTLGNIATATTEDKHTGDQPANEQLFMFEKSEKEFSNIVREKLGLTSDDLVKQDWIYRGIVELYSLFKEGLSDPKNFQQSMGSAPENLP